MTAQEILDIAISPGRKTECIFIRHATVQVLTEAGLTSTRIGELINRDHTTVLHSRNTHHGLMATGHLLYCLTYKELQEQREELLSLALKRFYNFQNQQAEA
jgi:hypothetical protein